MSNKSVLNAALNKPDVSEYDALGVVTMSLGGRYYQVRFDDGAELIATNISDDDIPDGTGAGLIADHGGWILYALR